jgi:predicted nucleic acid-binding protein
MPQVICDTSPLNYLVLIDAANILPRLFSAVIVPPAVARELAHPRAPAPVRDWIARPPSWLSVARINSLSVPQLPKLHPGECEVLALGIEYCSAILLIDDRDAADEAAKRGLSSTGTLGLLDRAASVRLLNLRETFDRLRGTSFRAPQRIMARMLEEDARRRR